MVVAGPSESAQHVEKQQMDGPAFEQKGQAVAR